MFRRRNSQGGVVDDGPEQPQAALLSPGAPASCAAEPAAAAAPQPAGGANSRRRSSDPMPPPQPPPAAGSAPRPPQLAPLRARVSASQQAAAVSAALRAAASAAGAAAAGSADAAAPTTGGFTVFSNPLSEHVGPAAVGADVGGPRQAAGLLPQLPAAERQQQQRQQQQQQVQEQVQEQAKQPAPAAASLQAPPSKQMGSKMQQQQPLHFEVMAADEPAAGQLAGQQQQHDNLIDYAGHDQAPPELLGTAAALATQFVYNQDTGQLCQVGAGSDATRLARHYVEDWNTGQFIQLAQPGSGCCAWLRRRPRGAPSGPGAWPGSGEHAALRSLAEFTSSMGAAMATLGLFAQGLAGGLGLLALLMSTGAYASGGLEAFLASYAAQAQAVNRAFVTLISLSLVAACARLGYDQLGTFRPSHLRLRLVDGCGLLLYTAAYLANLLATPTDDLLSYEARRDPRFWAMPLPAAFLARLTLWQVLHVGRVAAVGLAWGLVCYRSNPHVLGLVYEARQQQHGEAEPQQREEGHSEQLQALDGASWASATAGAAAGAGAGSMDDCGSMAARRAQQQQQQQHAMMPPSTLLVSTADTRDAGSVAAGGWTRE